MGKKVFGDHTKRKTKLTVEELAAKARAELDAVAAEVTKATQEHLLWQLRESQAEL